MIDTISTGYVPLKLVPMPLLEEYGQRHGVSKAPTFLVFDPDGREIGRSTGMVDWETGKVDLGIWLPTLRQLCRRL